MQRRQPPIDRPLPRLWLMTDARQGTAIWQAIMRLPRGSGVIFRHYALDPRARAALFVQVRAACRRRRHLLLLAGSPGLATQWRADGTHGRHRGAVTAPVHNARERVAAQRAGARLLFVSPVFATRSHPGGRTLGRRGLAAIVRDAQVPVIALGGIDRRRARTLGATRVKGWAAIDAWSAPG